MLEGMGICVEGDKGEKKEWDNCNNIINKIYFIKSTPFRDKANHTKI